MQLTESFSTFQKLISQFLLGSPTLLLTKKLEKSMLTFMLHYDENVARAEMMKNIHHEIWKV